MGIVIFVDFENKAVTGTEETLVLMPSLPSPTFTEELDEDDLGDGCFML